MHVHHHGEGAKDLRLRPRRKSRTQAERARRKALRKAARNQSGTPDARSLELTEYVLVLTSVPEATLSAALVLELYRLRWQIELAFKRLKSLLAFGHVPKSSDQSAKSWMQAKVLTSLMIERVALCGRFFPPGDMTDEHCRVWPVFIEIRDALKAVLAPPLALRRLIRRGPQIARRLRQEHRRRKMQRSKLAHIFRRILG